MKTIKNFYGMKIVIGSLFLTVFSMAIINNTASFYMEPICKTLGFTVAEFSAVYSMAALGAAVGAMLAGTLVQKLPIRLMMIIGALGTGLGFGGMSMATQIWQFYILMFVTDCSMALITNIPIATMLSNWYIDNRGKMIGLVFAGTGLGSLVFSPLTEFLIGSTGWQTSFQIMAGIILITALPVCIFVFYKTPADVGQKPFTFPEGSPEAEKAAAARAESKDSGSADDIESGVPRKVAFTTPAFWLLAGCLLLMGIMCSGVMVHIPTYLYQNDMNAGFVMAVLSVGILVGTFGSGVLMDKLGLVKVLMLCVIAYSAGMVCLYFVPYTAVLSYVMAVCLGLSVCIAKVGPPMLTSTIFGMKDYSFLYGLNYTIFLVGSVTGPVLCGILYQINESYSMVWIINIIFAVGMFFMSVVATKAGGAARRKAERIEEQKIAN